jgi:predicted NBD/HSP70 family sugar kinase
MMRFGIDLGGTKIEIVALDPEGRELIRRRIATPQHDYRATIDAVTGLVESVDNELQVRGSVGIGTPGSISRATGLLRGSNSVCLNGQPIQRDLEAALGREIRITNDANCFALSEASDGAGPTGHGGLRRDTRHRRRWGNRRGRPCTRWAERDSR